ncbi:MAG: hypothetical protein AAFV92_12260 [Pseudomonadota bacterium]
MMEKVIADLGKASVDAMEFVGEFVYAPFGYESSDMVNGVTLFAAIAIVALVIYKSLRPAPHVRAKYRHNRYDFGRNI